MSSSNVYHTVRSSLQVPEDLHGAVDRYGGMTLKGFSNNFYVAWEEDPNRAEIDPGAVFFFANTKNYRCWVERALFELSRVAISGRMVVQRKGEDAMKRYVVSPDGVTFQRPTITWSEPEPVNQAEEW